MKRISTARKAIGELDAHAAAELVSAVTDVVLILDSAGIVRDVAWTSDDLAAQIGGHWLGQPWNATVTVASKPSVDALLQEAASVRGATGPRQVIHPTPDGISVPVLYVLMRVGSKGRAIAVGRDLRPVAALQQRLVEAQQAVDLGYARLRGTEARNRLLFQLASEAVLIVDAATLRIVEANSAASRILGIPARRIPGRAFPDGFDPAGTRAVNAMLMTARAGGKAADVRVRLADGSRNLAVSASVFREDRATCLLVRVNPLDGETARELTPLSRTRFMDFVDASPDGFVMTDERGTVVAANPAFLDLAQVPTEDQACGQALDTWLGRPGIDVNLLLTRLRVHGSVRMFATTVRAANGSGAEIEVSGVSLEGRESPCYGFTIRDVGPRVGVDQRAAPPMSRSVEQLTELVGRVPLKGIVRETTDIIERLCIEAALEFTRDNRASAAELLGLSRQSLYVKLRRFGLGDRVDRH